MRWRLLLKEYEPEIMHVTGITYTVADAISRFDVDPTCNISEDILKGLDENDNIHGKHMHSIKVFSQSFLDNADLCTSGGECCANISEAK